MKYRKTHRNKVTREKESINCSLTFKHNKESQSKDYFLERSRGGKKRQEENYTREKQEENYTRLYRLCLNRCTLFLRQYYGGKKVRGRLIMLQFNSVHLGGQC